MSVVDAVEVHEVDRAVGQVAVAGGRKQPGSDVGQMRVGIAGLVTALGFAQFRAQLQSIVAVPGLRRKQLLEATEEGFQGVAPVSEALAEALLGIAGRGVVGIVKRLAMATEKSGSISRMWAVTSIRSSLACGRSASVNSVGMTSIDKSRTTSGL